jgi:hypothetical protein
VSDHPENQCGLRKLVLTWTQIHKHRSSWVGFGSHAKEGSQGYGVADQTQVRIETSFLNTSKGARTEYSEARAHGSITVPFLAQSAQIALYAL